MTERLGPVERLEELCDPGSLDLLRTAVRAGGEGVPTADGDGVAAGTASVLGRPIACYAQDASLAGGALGSAQADTIVRVLELAGRARMPVVGFVESSGARLQESVSALAGYARIFRATVGLTGVVPQITVVTGACAGGGAYSPALTDVVVMAEDATMFVTGPRVVRQVCGEEVTPRDLGGQQVHRRNGVAQIVAPSVPAASASVRELLGYLPQAAGEPTLLRRSIEPLRPDVASFVPSEPRLVYDVRDVARGLADGGGLLELCPRWARNMVTAFGRVDGAPVGFVANQPRHMGGVIDTEACAKAVRFIDLCDRFGIPLVVLVDTPGFLPGSTQESAGIITAGAGLVRAFARAGVPKLTVVLRKAYGGAYIAMNSNGLGASLSLAWPDAEIGIMGAREAVRISARRRLAAPDAAANLLEQLAAEYADQHCTGAAAARAGHVDEIIEPEATRARLASAIRAFDGRWHHAPVLAERPRAPRGEPAEPGRPRVLEPLAIAGEPA
jgi:acetyl-CoA carboxylase carboxyltransferase component